MPPTQPSLSSLLPPLICGTATFNSQYNKDLSKVPTTEIVHKALSLGVRAFDTSPYYGPSEELLGKALNTPVVHQNFPRSSYYLLTKVGRIASSNFDYSPTWVRHSISRSLTRLQTSYLDVVYCHDVEFVSPSDVLSAVTELRRIRDTEGTIKYIGISGYPIDVLADLAEMILRETGEPLDIVQSYANFTLQNTTLSSLGVPRFKAAGVDVVTNASVLGMGLMRRSGVPVGAQGDFHPAPEGLRQACRAASDYCDWKGEKLEVVALRWGFETWLREGKCVGSKGDPASGLEWKGESIEEVGGERLGVSVMGVSNLGELDETMRVWRSILDGMEGGREKDVDEERKAEREWSLKRRAQVEELARGVWEALGEWKDYAWESPGADFVNLGNPEFPHYEETKGGQVEEAQLDGVDDLSKSSRL